MMLRLMSRKMQEPYLKVINSIRIKNKTQNQTLARGIQDHSRNEYLTIEKINRG